MTMTAAQIHRFSCDDFNRMWELGFFKDVCVELVDGEVVEMSPMNDPHMVALGLVNRLLTRLFPNDWICYQAPLKVDQTSVPQPDFTVFRGDPRNYGGVDAAESILLVLEIADSTLAFDRSAKAAIYARAGVEEYWILNLVDRQLEVHRSPMAGPGGGHRYEDIRLLAGSQLVATLVNPAVPALVADLLP